jgi:two-component system nitrogen regulation sensor histidine kinase NtrY
MTTREKGTGLGLAIVKKIIEDHGGTLTLNDAPNGRGAMISVTLPASATGYDAKLARAGARTERIAEKVDHGV